MYLEWNSCAIEKYNRSTEIYIKSRSAGNTEIAYQH